MEAAQLEARIKRLEIDAEKARAKDAPTGRSFAPVAQGAPRGMMADRARRAYQPSVFPEGQGAAFHATRIRPLGGADPTPGGDSDRLQLKRESLASSFSHWQRWRAVRSQPLFLTGNYPGEDEEELLSFVAHKSLTMNYAYSAILEMLYAVRYEHLMDGWPDPLQDKVRLDKGMGSLR